MIEPMIQKNDKKAYWLIGIFSVVVFVAVSVVARVQIPNSIGPGIHNLALMNAVINSVICVLLILALMAVKKGRYLQHRNLMMTALTLSVVFLVSYCIHKLFAGEARFGDTDFNGVVDAAEKAAAGSLRTVYLIILFTHITLAGLILPLILFTSYRALTAEFPKHTKLARITWPVWFYVSLTGPVVYWLIRPYYN